MTTETLTKTFDLEELKLSVAEKMHECYDEGKSFENGNFDEFVDEALEEIGYDFWDDTEGYLELCNVIRTHWKDPFYVLAIDECETEEGIPPTAEQHKMAVEGADFLNSMFERGCWVAEFVLEEWLKDKTFRNLTDEEVEIIVPLVLV